MEELGPFVTKYNDSSYVFKSCSRVWIVVLWKLPDTITNESRPVVDRKCAKFRADKLQVVDIIHKFDQTNTCDSIRNSVYADKQLEYKKGEIIEVKDFDTNVNEVRTTGIHYYKTMKVAFYLELETVRDGELIFWRDNKQMQSNRTYKDGTLEGGYISWHINGQMEYKGIYKDGNPEGEWIFWHSNGQMRSKGIYKNGFFIQKN